MCAYGHVAPRNTQITTLDSYTAAVQLQPLGPVLSKSHHHMVRTFHTCSRLVRPQLLHEASKQPDAVYHTDATVNVWDIYKS
jgi:hypothetical protein